MSVSQTAVIETTAPLVVTLYSQENKSLAAVKELGAILIEHKEWNDFLSLQFFKRGQKWMKFVLLTQGHPEHRKEEALKHLNKFNALIRNPYNGHLLKDPWLVEDLVWEKSVLERLQNCFAIVFPDKQIQPKPHQFALKILAWREKFLDDFNRFQSVQPPVAPPTPLVGLIGECTLVLARPIVEAPLDFVTAYRDLTRFSEYIASIERDRKNRQECKELKIYKRQLEASLIQTEKRSQEDRERLKQTITKNTDEMLHEMRDMRTSYRNTIETIEKNHQEVVQDVRKDLKETQQQVQDLKTKNESLRVNQNQLLSQLHHLQGQLNHLRCELDNQDSGCVIS